MGRRGGGRRRIIEALFNNRLFLTLNFFFFFYFLLEADDNLSWLCLASRIICMKMSKSAVAVIICAKIASSPSGSASTPADRAEEN